jgi:lysozyme
MEKSILIDETIAELKRDEGFRTLPYQCTEGVWTIGYGFTNLTEREAALVLNMRVNSIHYELLTHEWYRNLNLARQSVVIQMAFQLGMKGLFKFHQMILALKGGFYNQAAIEMRHSKWARQTPNRAIRLADKMQIGR